MSHGNPKIQIGENVNLNPRVSVVTPAYNSSEFIAETIEGVLSQTFDDFEHIIVNDGSKDTEELRRAIAPFKDEVIYIERENGGAGAARNTGISVAKGEFLAFVDADDIWNDEFLASQLEELEGRNLDMVYSDAEYFGAVNDPERTFFDRSPSNGEVNPVALIHSDCNVILSGTLIKKKCVDSVHGFTETGLPIPMEDFDLWFRLAKSGINIGYQRQVLLKYRVHETNISGGQIDMARRDLLGVKHLAEVYELTPEEEQAVVDRASLVEAQIAVETGKRELVHGDYENARKNFGLSKSDSLKTKLIAAVVQLNPRIARFLFKTLRRNEFEQLSAE